MRGRPAAAVPAPRLDAVRSTAEPRLDVDQRRVVACRDRTIRVVAPAGAGKTGTLVERVLDRVQAGLDPRRILVLTFDTAAAETLTARLAGRAAEAGVSLTGLRVSTLNAFGYALLRRHAPAEFRPVVSGAERETAAAEALAALARRSPEHDAALPPLEAREWAELLARLKNALLDPRAVDLLALARELGRDRELLAAASGRWGRRPNRRRFTRLVEAVAWLHAAHERALSRRGVMDFDDQKLRACLVLGTAPELMRRFQRRWAEVVVDEFQDINRLDFELIGILAARARLVVVGDDDQAIYAFRGCSPDWIIELEARSGRPVASLELSTNYRNPPNLLAAAVRLIRRNRHRIAKQPVASRTDDAAIELACHGSAGEQAAAVAGAIASARHRDPGLRWRDFALLYRMNAQSRPLAAALAAVGIPHDVRADDDENAGVAADAVQLLTYFRAKGRQWPVVFLTSCNEGVAPHRRSPVEDERRLFYVAMTRASRALHAYWLDPADGAHPPPSRFLREAGLLRR